MTTELQYGKAQQMMQHFINFVRVMVGVTFYKGQNYLDQFFLF